MGFNVKKDEDEAQVNELVDVIDRLMMGGQGHLTIDIDETEEGLNVKSTIISPGSEFSRITARLGAAPSTAPISIRFAT